MKKRYINSIMLPGMTEPYYFQSDPVGVFPVTCPKCGASFELHDGSGKCEHCGTNFSSQFKLMEVSETQSEEAGYPRTITGYE